VGMGMSNWIKIDEKQGFMPGTPFCHSFGSWFQPPGTMTAETRPAAPFHVLRFCVGRDRSRWAESSPCSLRFSAKLDCQGIGPRGPCLAEVLLRISNTTCPAPVIQAPTTPRCSCTLPNVFTWQGFRSAQSLTNQIEMGFTKFIQKSGLDNSWNHAKCAEL
jgi:hypothetical protein